VPNGCILFRLYDDPEALERRPDGIGFLGSQLGYNSTAPDVRALVTCNSQSGSAVFSQGRDRSEQQGSCDY